MGTRTSPSVLWREGMFLCPQHLQAFANEIEARIHSGESLGIPGDWGILSLEIDEQALERDELRVIAASVMFRDGTLASFPSSATVAQREFAPMFEGPELQVHLGIPARRPGMSQLAENGEQGARYQSDFEEVFDEYLTNAPRELEVRTLRGRLFFGDEDRSGYECVPLARLVRRGKPVAKSVISDSYIPPVLACGGSSVLMGLLDELAEAVRDQARDLAARISDTTALSSVERGADLAGFVKLQAVNQCVAPLEQLRGLPMLHPFAAYQLLIQAVGNLAIFGQDRVVPDLPVYDHADQDGCFAAVVEAVRSLIVAEVTMPYDTLPFVKDPMREGFYRCEIPSEWFERSPLMFLGMEVAKPAEEVVNLVGGGVKLLSEADIDRVLQGVVPGIGLQHLRTAPMAFPKRPDLHFFRIETEGDSRDAWLNVREAGAAILLSALGGEGDVTFHMYVELRD